MTDFNAVTCQCGAHSDNQRANSADSCGVLRTAWLIECVPPLGDVLYFCAVGDWCSNPNHAHKFATEDEARSKYEEMNLSDKFRIAEHGWE